MVARLKKIDAVVSHKVDQPVLVRNPARPCARQQMPQRLGLPYPGEWFPQHSLDQIQDPHGDLTIAFKPMNQ
jgi:hypothetical protein